MLGFLFLIVGAAATTEDIGILYTDISVANTTDCLHRIRDVTLNYYEFKFDSVAGRRQMGVLGADAERFFPESVEVVPTYTFPNKEKGKPPVVFHNFPIVDKNAIFMHGVGALKELITLYNELESRTNDIKRSGDGHIKKFQEIEIQLSKETSEAIKEQRKLLETQNEYNEKKKILDNIEIEEFRKTMALELQERRSLLQFQEKLAIEQMKYEQELAKEATLEAIKLERELIEKKEALRRESNSKLQEKRREYDLDIETRKAQLELDKIRAEIRAKAEAERANEDVAMRQLKSQSDLDTKRMIETIHTISGQFSKIIHDIISQPIQLIIISSVIILLITLYYSMTALASAFRQFIQTRLGRPSLVRETSVRWTLPFFLSYFTTSESLSTGMKEIDKSFESVILSDEDRKRVLQLALTTRNTKRSGAPFRHVLLHGPPGTGKTLIARKLAESSNMDYAIMSGGDVGPLGEDAVTQLHGLFKWASRSKKGLLVFIDEAEAFLSSRGNMGVEEIHLRHSLNALLYQTGTQSTQFMLVLATNRPGDLDSAILDRMDVSLHIGLPEQEQRVILLQQYAKVHVLDMIKSSQRQRFVWFWKSTISKYAIDDKCCSKENIIAVAKLIKGFSGREIAKMMIAMQYTLLLAENKLLSLELFNATVKGKLKEHKEKKSFSGTDGDSS